ncbi:MAG TPA: pyridoxamine 5'-phosphate oxidase family protein [Pyrinomonadaceae bacterium]|nr:pyridoxamine 5'-phosphate oxidase family protein [Pyrinomonadaceae bacterium]
MKLVRETGSHFDLGDEEARRLLEEVLSRPLFAHLATASDEGPRESPVWFLWEGGALWIIGNRVTDSFPARVGREPRCAVGVVDFNVETGTVLHVGFRGRARLEGHDPARMERLLGRYMGERASWDARFVEILDDPDYIFVRFEPETAVVRDQSYKVGGPE